MTASAPRPRATYDDILRAPENMVAEIVGGELVLSPRPAGRHARASSLMGADLAGSFGRRRGGAGPGGWLIIDEPELHVAGILPDVYVPDLAGWRRERMGEVPESHEFTVCPDWVCEVFSPASSSRDLLVKGTLYHQAGVPWMWTVDPVQRFVDVYRAGERTWEHVARAEGDVEARLAPFDAVAFDLSEWWVRPAQ
ncbi:MAG: Uma2 family endonuclease [Myxococcota bacterium]